MWNESVTHKVCRMYFHLFFSFSSNTNSNPISFTSTVTTTVTLIQGADNSDASSTLIKLKKKSNKWKMRIKKNMWKVWSLDPVSMLCSLGCILLFFGALGLCDLLLAADGGFAQHHHSFRESCQNSLVPPPQRDSHKNHMLGYQRHSIWEQNI